MEGSRTRLHGISMNLTLSASACLMIKVRVGMGEESSLTDEWFLFN
jgi:hypothetical protein